MTGAPVSGIRAGSLFERLDPRSPQASLRGQSDVAERVRAIKRQLEALLNARRGGSASSPEFGLPDFNDSAVGSADLMLRITRGIREAIEANEPRVRVREIRSLPGAGSLDLSFRIDCTMSAGTNAEMLEIDLIMNGHNRHYRVL
jgi:type VI secretion system protein